MKANNWSSVEGPRELTERDQELLKWLEEYLGSEEDLYGWTRQVARLELQDMSVSEIAERIGCTRTTVKRKIIIIAELRAKFEEDYWWTQCHQE